MNTNNFSRFTTPMSPNSSRRDRETPQFQPLSPESIASPSPEPIIYQFEWAIDPYDPTKRLGPPEVALRNRLFAVEFRIVSAEVFRPEVRFYARAHPDLNTACQLVCERVTVNEWKRVALYIPHKGVFGIDVQVRPDRPGFLTGLVKHRYLTTVYDESDGVSVPLGALEHRVLFGGDQNQDENMEATAESNGQSALEETEFRADTDVQQSDDFFTQWMI